MLLREGAKSAVPTAGRLLGQGAVLGTGLAAAGMLDQQSEYSQPMTSGVGTADLQKFMMSQQLQNQKFYPWPGYVCDHAHHELIKKNL